MKTTQNEATMSDVIEQSDHAWSQEQIASFLAGGLSAAETERFESHVRGCAQCITALESLKRLDSQMNSLFAIAQPGPDLEDRAVQAFRSSRRPSTLRMPIRWPRRALAAAAALLFLGTFGALAASIVGNGRIPMPGDDLRTLLPWGQ